MPPTYSDLALHGVFAGFDQGSEVHQLAGLYWVVDEYDGTPPTYDVYRWKGDSRKAEDLPRSPRQKIVYLLLEEQSVS